MPLKIETLEVSTSEASPNKLPELARIRIERLRKLGTLTRAKIERVCGTPSAANQFINTAQKRGWLVATAWGEYSVPDERTLDLMTHIQNPALERFAAWASLIREHAGRHVAFAAPRIWRDTDLNVPHPMPVILLRPEDQDEQGTPPQWDAFQMDAQKPEPWRLVIPKNGHIDFLGLALRDVILLLRASRDPRWAQAARQLEARYGATPAMYDGLPRAEPPTEALRGQRTRKIGLGPPHRRRILAPPWYTDILRRSLYPVYGGPDLG